MLAHLKLAPLPWATGVEPMRHCRGGDSPLDFTDTVIAVARLRKCRRNHHKRASNARPYGVACTSDKNVGATIGRPLLRLSRKSVTVPAQFNLLPMSVAHCLNGRCPLRKGANDALNQCGDKLSPAPWEAWQIRFPPRPRYRVHAICVSAAAPKRDKKSLTDGRRVCIIHISKSYKGV